MVSPTAKPVGVVSTDWGKGRACSGSTAKMGSYIRGRVTASSQLNVIPPPHTLALYFFFGGQFFSSNSKGEVLQFELMYLRRSDKLTDKSERPYATEEMYAKMFAMYN